MMDYSTLTYLNSVLLFYPEFKGVELICRLVVNIILFFWNISIGSTHFA